MRGALLDRDGVLLLLDEKALYRKAVELAARGAGLERSLAALARAVRALNEAVRGLAVRTLEEEEALWRTLVLEVARELRVPPEELLPWRYYRFMRPAPGAERLLHRLKARNLKVGVLSNTLPSLRESLAHHGLARYVDGFFASCALGWPSPTPGPSSSPWRAWASPLRRPSTWTTTPRTWRPPGGSASGRRSTRP